MADDTNADIKKETETVMPVLKAAVDALGKIDKRDLTEIRAFNNPPRSLYPVISAVSTVLGKGNDTFKDQWAFFKREASEPRFLDRLINLDKNNMPEKTMKKIEAITAKDDF